VEADVIRESFRRTLTEPDSFDFALLARGAAMKESGHPMNLALFDFDGTITRGDTFSQYDPGR